MAVDVADTNFVDFQVKQTKYEYMVCYGDGIFWDRISNECDLTGYKTIRFIWFLRDVLIANDYSINMIDSNFSQDNRKKTLPKFKEKAQNVFQDPTNNSKYTPLLKIQGEYDDVYVYRSDKCVYIYLSVNGIDSMICLGGFNYIVTESAGVLTKSFEEKTNKKCPISNLKDVNKLTLLLGDSYKNGLSIDKINDILNVLVENEFIEQQVSDDVITNIENNFKLITCTNDFLSIGNRYIDLRKRIVFDGETLNQYSASDDVINIIIIFLYSCKSHGFIDDDLFISIFGYYNIILNFVNADGTLDQLKAAELYRLTGIYTVFNDGNVSFIDTNDNDDLKTNGSKLLIR